MRVKEVPWTFAAVAVSAVFLVVIGLGVAGYKITGVTKPGPIGLDKGGMEYGPVLSMKETARLVCGARNDVGNFGQQIEMSSPNKCSNICSATNEDNKKCLSTVVIDSANRIQGDACGWEVGSEYFSSDRGVFCCCY